MTLGRYLTPNWGRTRRRAGGAAAAVVVAGAAVAVALVVGTRAPSYRTATARDAPVVKTVAMTGTVEPVNRVTLSFGVTGTVASVVVHVGQRVAAGQTLATLATTSLTQQVAQDEAALRSAQATVVADEKSQVSTPAPGTAAGTGSGSVPGGPPAGTGSSSGGTGSGGAPTLAVAQRAVVTAQKAADSAEQAAASALATADAACGVPGAPGTGSGTGSGTTKTSPSSTTTTTASPSTGPGPATACATALHHALTAQQMVAADQRAVTTAEATLAKALSQGGGTTQGSGTGHLPPAPTTTGAVSTTPTTSPTGAGTGGRTASASTPKALAAQLASDQATVDTDNANLLDAQQSLAEATLTAPIPGTVGAVTVAKGQSTDPTSSTAAVTILTQHTFEAEGLVSPTQVPALGVGDTVSVTVDGRPAPIDGRVIRIGPVDTSLGYQYPVVVALPSGIPRLFTGSLCQMTVVERVAERTLAVPTSAVHTAHRRSYVTVLQTTGKPRRRPVAVGIVGIQETQILSGLRRGAQVVLAALGRPLPKPLSGAVAQHGSGVPVPFPGGRLYIIGNGSGGAFYSTSSP